MLPVFNILLNTKERSTTFYATALFAVHPVHTEAVCNCNYMQFFLNKKKYVFCFL